MGLGDWLFGRLTRIANRKLPVGVKQKLRTLPRWVRYLIPFCNPILDAEEVVDKVRETSE